MKVNTKGQVTIPAHIRSYLGITPQCEVDFQIEGEKVLLVRRKPTADRGPSRFARLRGILKNAYTTDAWLRATRE